MALISAADLEIEEVYEARVPLGEGGGAMLVQISSPKSNTSNRVAGTNDVGDGHTLAQYRTPHSKRVARQPPPMPEPDMA
eukprot:117215-Rhodomonas_salina.3